MSRKDRSQETESLKMTPVPQDALPLESENQSVELSLLEGGTNLWNSFILLDAQLSLGLSLCGLRLNGEVGQKLFRA